MKHEFDFEEVGKKVPYIIPENFFEEMQEQVTSRLPKTSHQHRRIFKWSPAVIALAAVLTAVMFIPLNFSRQKVDSFSQVVNRGNDWIEDLTDAELQALDDFSDYDVFMYQD